MKETHTKRRVVAELAGAAGISKRRAETVLDALAGITCREARKGFTIPGICRVSVVSRRARRWRNPRTGQTLLVAEHEALRFRPLKKAKDIVVPAPDRRVQVIAERADPPAPREAAATSAAAAPQTTVQTMTAPTVLPAPSVADFISFFCAACRQEIEATMDLAGQKAECPACGTPLRVPLKSQPCPAKAAIPVASRTPFEEMMMAASKNRTIRIELS